jgi:hypothetical protein
MTKFPVAVFSLSPRRPGGEGRVRGARAPVRGAGARHHPPSGAPPHPPPGGVGLV